MAYKKALFWVSFLIILLLTSQSISSRGRQLIEMQLFGTVNYDFGPPVEQRVFKLNKQTPAIELLNPKSKKIISFDELKSDHLILTFFSYMCGVCKSGKRIKMLDSIQGLTKKHIDGKTSIYLIFSNVYNQSDLEEWKKRLDLPFEIFFAKDIFSNDEKYVTDEDLKNDPLTIVLDRHKRVIFIEQPGMSEKDVYHSLESIIFQE